MKTNQIVAPVIADDFQSVTFTVKGMGELRLDMSKLHPDILQRAACVGMAQVRIVDAAAIGKADKSGAIIPEDVRTRLKYEAMAELIAHYETGTDQWAKRVASDAGASAAITVEAIARVKSISVEDASRMVDDYASKKGIERAAALRTLREAKAVAEAIVAIKRERSDNGERADEMLEELGE